MTANRKPSVRIEPTNSADKTSLPCKVVAYRGGKPRLIGYYDFDDAHEVAAEEAAARRAA